MDRQALVAQLLTGQDQMFGFLSDALDPASPRYTSHRDKSEGLPADAQVFLVHHPPLVRAHGLHPVKVALVQKGLGGSVTAPVVLDVRLPQVLVQSIWSTGANVAFDEGVVAVVPFGALAGSVVFSKRLMSQQETDGQSDKSPEGSHYPAVLVLAAVEASVSYK